MLQDLFHRFKIAVHENNLFHAHEPLLLAVSGGVDSVVLCELCHRAALRFAIVHCNFQLRGEESERDEKFVRELGKKYETIVIAKRFDTDSYARENKIGIQEAARNLRYSWFRGMVGGNKTAQDFPLANYLLTAHHADDNIETLMMNFFRGTGLKGLGGISPVQDYIRRPLLGFWKDELIEFARENDLSFVEDSSNESPKYTRNFFRNEIIPMISKAYPGVKSNLRDNIDRFREITHLYQQAVNGIKRKLYREKRGEIHIAIKELMSYENEALIFEIISDFGFSEGQVEELIKLADSESGRFIQSPSSGYRIIKFRNWFIISKSNSEEVTTVLIEEGMKEVPIMIQAYSNGRGNLKIDAIDNHPGFTIPPSLKIACIDSALVSFPMILRKWKQGDYFYPLGMKKKKKLARFFIDQKMSKTAKEQAWVIEVNKKIIWVVGQRIDDRFKVTPTTKMILRLSLETS